MEYSRFYKFFQGLWTFSREVRSLLSPSRNLLASIDSGHASFAEWKVPTPPETIMEINSQASGAVDRHQGKYLIYREQGLLTNHELQKTVPAASVSRQYIYTFPAPDDTQQTTIHVFHCSIKDRTLGAVDPWCSDSEEILVQCFTKGEHFHDLVFPALGGACEKLSDVKTKCVHFCDADVYEGEFHLLNCKKFSVMWTVKGPNKAYSIQTVYEKKG